MKKILLLITITAAFTKGFTQNVNIPDVNLKNALVNNSSINTNGDTEIQTTEANSAFGFLTLTNLQIANATGLEEFTGISGINLSNNDLTSVSFTNTNTVLEELNLTDNQLTGGMNLSGLQNLRYLTLALCNLTSFNPSTIPSLYYANCAFNNMTSIDFSSNTLLKGINMGHCTNLTSLSFSSASSPDITLFDITGVPGLIGDIDLSGFPVLEDVKVSGTNISGLNIANGNNVNMSTYNSLSCPNLSCITVDDVQFANTNFTNVSPGQTFSLDCNAVPPSDTLYVNINASGNNNGTSWTNAYTDARDAFLNSNDGDEVWVAKGTYIRNETDRNAIFGWISDSIKVYGGFSGNGTETSINDRNWNANPTIFSGDLGTVGDITDNAYTVFMGPIGNFGGSGNIINYALIDGIKIKDGNASETSYPQYNTCGGGLSITDNVNFYILRNIEIYDNYADHGAGLYHVGASSMNLTMENVIIHSNSGGTSPAIEIRNSNGTLNVDMLNCLVYNNESNSSATTGNDYGSVAFLAADGGTHNFKIFNSTFANNTSETGDESEGDIRTYRSNGGGSFTMQNSIMYNNSANNNITDLNYLGADNPWNTYVITNNILENGTSINNTGISNNSAINPLFIDAANSDFRLKSNSSAIDDGTQNNVTVLNTDLAGNPRIYGSGIDLGAYEFQGSYANISETAAITFSIFPSPTHGNVNITSQELIQSVFVFNSMGQNIASFKSAQFSLEEMPAGIYFIKVNTANQTFTERLIKQ